MTLVIGKQTEIVRTILNNPVITNQVMKLLYTTQRNRVSDQIIRWLKLKLI